MSPSALEGCILEMRSQKVWIQIGYNITKSLDVRQFLQVRGKGKMAGRYQPRFIRNCMKRRDIHKVAHGKCNFVNMLLKRDLVVESCTDKQRNACRILKENKFPKKFGFCDEYDEYWIYTDRIMRKIVTLKSMQTNQMLICSFFIVHILSVCFHFSINYLPT